MLTSTAFGVTVVLVSLEVGRLVAGGNVRMVSVLLIAIAVLLLAELSPEGVLLFAIAVSPLSLYMQGLRASLFVGVVIGLWLSWLADPRHRRSAEDVGLSSVRPWAWLLMGVLATTLVSLARGSSLRTGADIGAVAKLLLGVAFFVGCVIIIRTPRDVARAFAAVVVGGCLAATITALELAHLPVPGILGSVGTLQLGESGIASNLRVGGPFGDYELFAEYLALVGIVALALGTRSRSGRYWLAFVPVAVAGLALTSTRSGLIVLAVGALALVALGRRAGFARGRIFVTGLVVAVLAVPVIRALQSSLGSGFLFQRFATTSSAGNSLLALIDRGRVWKFFLANRPHGLDLFFGTGPSFDLERYGTFPHSLPLTLIFTVGLEGAAAFALLLLMLAWRNLRAWRLTRDPLPLLAALVVAVFAMNEVKIEFIRVFNYEWFIWGLLGVCAATANVYARAAPE